MATRENSWAVKINDQPSAADVRSCAVEIDHQHKNTGKSAEKQQSPNTSIYMVPRYIRRLNKHAYKPQIVSFGPYHHGDRNVKPMEEHKARALSHFLETAKKSLHDVTTAMAGVVQKLRGAYQSLDKKWAEDERFLRLMILDGCFMLEIIRVATKNANDRGLGYEVNEPIFSNHGNLYTVPCIRRDMMMIENQLPLRVLYKLVFVEGRCNCVEYVNELVLRFWSKGKLTLTLTLTLREKRPHLLDMLRFSQFDKQSSTNPSRGPENSSIFPIIRSASELLEAGIRFKKSEFDSLDIRFHNGVLSLPKLTVDDNTKYMFLNLMAYERLHVGTGNDVTSFVCFMDQIIDSAKDINLLRYRGIIKNAVGSDKAAAELFNRLTQGVVLEPNSRIDVIHYKVNKFCRKTSKNCRSHWARLVHYLTSPWTTFSLVGATVLLVLTVLQTIYTMLQFYRSA